MKATRSHDCVNPVRDDWDFGLTEPDTVELARIHQIELGSVSVALPVLLESATRFEQVQLCVRFIQPLSWVLLLHLGLFYLLSLPWFAQSTQLKPRPAQPKALKAYLVSVPVKKREVDAGLKPVKQDKLPVEEIKPEKSPNPVVRPVAELKSSEQPQQSAIFKKDEPQSQPIAAEQLESGVTGDLPDAFTALPAQTESVSMAANFSMESDTAQGQVGKPSLETQFIGRSFLKQRQAQAVLSLAGESAGRYTAKRSLSEMDGEMSILRGGSAYDITKEKTLDHQFDPNRIVRIGDTCYRVVKLGDPLNSHKENLGYPFKCGEDQEQKSIDKGIAEHLSRMNLANPRQ